MPLPSILFVSGTTAAQPFADPSVRYRCFNMSQELARRGFRSHVVTQQVFERNLSDLKGFDRYIMHRPRLTQQLADFLLGLAPDQAVADFDELIFDVCYAELTPSVRVRQRSAAEVRQYVASMAESMRLVSRATVSTGPLARYARHFEHLSLSVVHNHVDPGFLGIARLLRDSRPPRTRPFALGYFAGTATHDLDLQLIAPVLVRVLCADPTTRLLVVGPVVLPEELTAHAAQIRQTGVLSFHALPLAMAQCRKVLAPLEATVFNECKSGLKFFEAALVGCEVLATPIADVDRFQSPLLTRCTTADEWSAALASDRGLQPADIERCARELEATVRIDAALPGWFHAVGLEAE
jgi:hypothetical protein